MLIALGGFALVRVLRIDLSPRKKVVITYDSNLRDKIAKSRAEYTGVTPRYTQISNELRTVREDLDRGEVQRSLETLRDAERPDNGIPSGSDLANGMRLAEQAVKNGDPDRARSILNSLLDEMAASGADN